MPAASEPTARPPLPQTFRPLGVRMAIYVAGGLLLLVVLVTWFAFPPEIRRDTDILYITRTWTFARGDEGIALSAPPLN